MNQRPLRSVLLAPGDRAEVLRKLARSGTDAAVADWEDGVGADSKAAARERTRAFVEEGEARPPWLAVRVNGLGTPWHDDDLAALPPGLDGVVVPKGESAEGVRTVRAALDRAGHGSVALVVGIESVLGVLDARPVLAAGADAAYFGAEDFVADLGGTRSASNVEVLYARSRVALAARAAGIPVLDQVVTAFRDLERFEREAVEARHLGFRGKLCIHPGQVPVANQAFSPTDDELRWARAVVDAAAGGEGVVVVDGAMVDEPLVRQARALLATADAIAAAGAGEWR